MIRKDAGGVAVIYVNIAPYVFCYIAAFKLV